MDDVVEAVTHHDPLGRLIAFDTANSPFTVRRILTVSEPHDPDSFESEV